MILLKKLKTFRFNYFYLFFIFIISCSQNPKEKMCKEMYGVMKDCFYANLYDKDLSCNALSNLAKKTALKEYKKTSISEKFYEACYFGCNRYKLKMHLPKYENFKERFCLF